MRRRTYTDFVPLFTVQGGASPTSPLLAGVGCIRARSAAAAAGFRVSCTAMGAGFDTINPLCDVAKQLICRRISKESVHVDKND